MLLIVSTFYRKWGTETGDQRGVNGSRSKFLSKSIRRPISRKSPQTLKPRIWESSYGLAISKQNTLGSEMEAIARNPPNSSFTGSDRSDRSLQPVRPVGLEWMFSDRSDRFHRPVRQPANKASNVESRANEVQIQRNLEDTFTSVPWTCPQEISPKRLKDLENSREDQSGLGFSQEHKKLQFVRTRDSKGFGTRLDGLEWSQRVHQNTNSKDCLLQTQNTPKEENSNPKRKGGRGGRELSTQRWISNEFHSWISEEFTYTRLEPTTPSSTL